MISPISIAGSRYLKGGWFSPETGRSVRAAIRRHGAGAGSLASVDALHRRFPGAEKWPVACAGFSGGGKGVGYIAPLLAKSGCHVIGIYMTGVNEEHLTAGYTKIHPGADLLNTPIYISAGRDDRIATMKQQSEVAGAIKRAGFQRIRIGTFQGGHEANDAQTSIALRWFR